MTQTEAILAYLNSGRTLTVAEALTQFGVYALSQRAGELRKQGYPVVSEMVDLPNGKRVARYSLKVAYG
jgi:hypothetical protein